MPATMPCPEEVVIIVICMLKYLYLMAYFLDMKWCALTPPNSMYKMHMEKVYPWIWILALSISSRNLELYLMKLICLVKLWSVRKSHIASEYCLPLNKCSCHCCYHCCNIYFIICYLGDERGQSIKQRSLQREPSEQIGKDKVGIGITVKWEPCAHCLICSVVCARLLLFHPFPSPFNK